MTASQALPPIVLNGFIGVGKTTVGRQVAEQLGVPFKDLDTALAEAIGRPIAKLFAEGEGAYRAREQEVLRSFDYTQPFVLAVGGGSLVGAASQYFLRAAGAMVIVLDAAEDAALKRLTEDKDSERPQLGEEEWRARYRNRAAGYARFPYHVETTDRTPDAVAADVIALVRAEAPRFPLPAPAPLQVTPSRYLITPHGPLPVHRGAMAAAVVGTLAHKMDASDTIIIADAGTAREWGDSVRYDLLSANIPTPPLVVPRPRVGSTDRLMKQLETAGLTATGIIITMGPPRLATVASALAATHNRRWLYIPVPPRFPDDLFRRVGTPPYAVLVDTTYR